jgi:hypothetical protein
LKLFAFLTISSNSQNVLLLIINIYQCGMPKGEKNSLAYRREQTANSNRNRWKDGCPDSTRMKLSEAAKRREAKKREQNENGSTIF